MTQTYRSVDVQIDMSVPWRIEIWFAEGGAHTHDMNNASRHGDLARRHNRHKCPFLAVVELELQNAREDDGDERDVDEDVNRTIDVHRDVVCTAFGYLNNSVASYNLWHPGLSQELGRQLQERKYKPK